MSSLNLNTLVKIESFDRRLNERYEWKSEKTSWFGLSKRKAGFYYAFSISEEFAYTLEEAQKRFIVENNLLYDKPYVRMRFANPSCDLTEEYDTLKEAEVRCEEVKNLSINSIWLKS